MTSEITPTAWILAYGAAFIIGLSKAGIKGIAVMNVTLMALAFGAKESTGMVVPLLILADVFAVVYYNRHTQWKYVFKVLPWMAKNQEQCLLIGHLRVLSVLLQVLQQWSVIWQALFPISISWPFDYQKTIL